MRGIAAGEQVLGQVERGLHAKVGEEALGRKAFVGRSGLARGASGPESRARPKAPPPPGSRGRGRRPGSSAKASAMRSRSRSSRSRRVPRTARRTSAEEPSEAAFVSAGATSTRPRKSSAAWAYAAPSLARDGLRPEERVRAGELLAAKSFVPRDLRPSDERRISWRRALTISRPRAAPDRAAPSRVRRRSIRCGRRRRPSRGRRRAAGPRRS